MTVSVRVQQLGGIQQLAADIDVSGTPSEDVQRRERVVEVAAELVCRFAPEAPDIVLKEAIYRTASWLLHSNQGSISKVETGPRSTEYAVSQTGALRHSGAMSLLSPWKVRRAGAI